MEEFVMGGVILKAFPDWRYRCADCHPRRTFKTAKGARAHWFKYGGKNSHFMVVPSVAVERKSKDAH